MIDWSKERAPRGGRSTKDERYYPLEKSIRDIKELNFIEDPKAALNSPSRTVIPEGKIYDSLGLKAGSSVETPKLDLSAFESFRGQEENRVPKITDRDFDFESLVTEVAGIDSKEIASLLKKYRDALQKHRSRPLSRGSNNFFSNIELAASIIAYTNSLVVFKQGSAVDAIRKAIYSQPENYLLTKGLRI